MALSQSNLRSGTYWLRVSATEQGNARYRLTLTAEPPAVSAIDRSSNHFVSKVLQLTNSFRRQNHLKPLRLNDRLTAAAQQHSQDMALQDFFAHEGRNGSTVQARGLAAGYRGSIGENIAAGQPTPQAVVQAWIDSAPHRANLLDPRYRDIGIGFFNNLNDSGTTNYSYYWAQDFGIPTM
ncbi:MAG: CAP domain-containing protein [Microcoleus sp. SIO2G3]|nr:CAP domain-containing protein [Microcoleus sp. SIO2G3]